MPMAPAPSIHPDHTITAVVAQPAQPFSVAQRAQPFRLAQRAQQVGETQLLTLLLPGEISPGLVGGRFFLARCGAQTELEREEQWQMYLRRPLFVAMNAVVPPGEEEKGEIWEFALAGHTTPGDRWLASLEAGETINLLGPLGQGFNLQPLAHNLLLLADFGHAPLLLSTIDLMLNRGGRVTFLLRTEDKGLDGLRTRLPIPVELRLAATENEWQQHLAETIRWADQICMALPSAAYTPLAATIRQLRFRLDANFAQAFVHADLACGVGACLACITPLPDGSHTRACVHGPVFDLARLAGPI